MEGSPMYVVVLTLFVLLGDFVRPVLSTTGPLCYNCPLLTDPGTCGHTTRCGRDELCMLHELKPGVDGGKRYMASCEPETVCENLRNHKKRSYIYCHNCCKDDLCNNHCGDLTTTTSLPTTTARPTTKPTTRPKPTTITATTTTTSHVTYPIMCYSCPSMEDPSSCRHLVPCSTGHACMLQTTGISSSGHTIYKSSCEHELLCSAISRSFSLVGKRDGDDNYNSTVDVEGRGLQKRSSQCNKCCRDHLCNNHCDSPDSNSHVTTTAVSTTTTTVQHHTTASTTNNKNLFSLSYVGCFRRGTIVVGSGSHTHSSHMTVKSCVHHCQRTNYTYAALMSGSDCVCSDTDVSSMATASDSRCNRHCAGNRDYFCGGDVYISLYKTQQLCYKCDMMTGPQECHTVTACSNDEICILYQTEDQLVSSKRLYHAGCSWRKVCEVFYSLPDQNHGHYCHTCCTGPLCNDVCATTTHTTHAPTTHLTHRHTHAPTTTRAPTTHLTHRHTHAPTTTRAPTTHQQTHAPKTTRAPTTHQQTHAPKTTRAPTTHQQTHATKTTRAPTTHQQTHAPTTTRAPTTHLTHPRTHAPTTHPTNHAHAPTVANARSHCEQDDFVYIPSLHLCYKMMNILLSHADAERRCKQYDATLAMLDEPGKLEIIQTLLQFEPHFANQMIYIGGSKNSTFTWSNGQHMTFVRCNSLDGNHSFHLTTDECIQHQKFICTKYIS